MKSFLKKIFYHIFQRMFLQFKKMSYFCHRIWRDGGVVDRGGLENR